jgi:hypothetical protein
MNGFLVMLILKLNPASVRNAKALTGINRDGMQRQRKGASMEEETNDEKPTLLDVLYNQLGMPRLTVSQMINGVIRDEIIKSLISSGIMTREQFSATLDKAQHEVQDFCDDVERDMSESGKLDKTAREILQNNREAATSIIDGLRKRIIEPSSQPSQQD